MSVRRIVLPAVCAASTIVFWAIPGAVRAAENDPAAALKVALREVARGLESPAFNTREATSEQLISAHASAVPVMLAVANEGNLEAAVRAVGILEAIYIAGDAKDQGTTVDEAERALDELSRTGRPSVAERADLILESHYDIRERRVVAEIQRFHGVPKYGQPGEIGVGWNPRFNPAPAPMDRAAGGSKDKGDLTWVILGPKWTGGDEGLKQVARLKRLQTVYRIQGCPVSDEAVVRLRAAIPGVRIEARGAAKLGITHAGTLVNDKGCVITEIQEGEAAANAGLRPQDRILRFGDHEVEDFYGLVDLLRNYRPGEIVETVIVREDETKIVPITLTGWD
jgi:PDZ domain